MAQTLDEFVAEVKKNIETFEKEYRAKADAEPEYYPLEMPDHNSGLWIEFFMGYLQGAGV